MPVLRSGARTRNHHALAIQHVISAKQIDQQRTNRVLGVPANRADETHLAGVRDCVVDVIHVQVEAAYVLLDDFAAGQKKERTITAYQQSSQMAN